MHYVKNLNIIQQSKAEGYHLNSFYAQETEAGNNHSLPEIESVGTFQSEESLSGSDPNPETT